MTYEGLLVRELINADSMKTTLGGSLMAPEVLDAMRRAGGTFVDMFALQEAVGVRIAELTHNEAAFVCTGAAAGIILATLAAMTGPKLDAIATAMRDGISSLPRRDFIVQCGQRNPYDPSIEFAGGRLVQVGNILQTFAWELEAAISPSTAGIFFFAGRHLGYGCLPFEEVARIANTAHVPLIVDAAAQLPPKENLWWFTEHGADLVIFSGGKELRGPQASGLIVGHRELIAACALHASPNQRLARSMKVGKEEMVGLLAAIELYLDHDETDEIARCERIVAAWQGALDGTAGLSAVRDYPGTDGRPLPRLIAFVGPSSGLTGLRLQEELRSGDPSIAVAVAAPDAIFLNPELLRPGEEEIVLSRVLAVVRSADSPSIAWRG